MPAETTESDNPAKDPRIMGFNAVRRALGIIGLGLPLSLFIYGWVVEGGMQPSISEFYYTAMGDVLVGSLCAIGIFLIAYKGFPRETGEKLSDRIVARVAGAGAIGVALFPTRYKGGDLCGANPCVNTGITNNPEWLHIVSTIAFFVCLALFCFFLFPKGERKRGTSVFGSPASRIYFLSGCALSTAILALGLHWIITEVFKLTTGFFAWNYYVFTFETIGIVAFAFSWLTKGKIMAGIRELRGLPPAPARTPGP